MHQTLFKSNECGRSDGDDTCKSNNTGVRNAQTKRSREWNAIIIEYFIQRNVEEKTEICYDLVCIRRWPLSLAAERWWWQESKPECLEFQILFSCKWSRRRHVMFFTVSTVDVRPMRTDTHPTYMTRPGLRMCVFSPIFISSASGSNTVELSAVEPDRNHLWHNDVLSGSLICDYRITVSKTTRTYGRFLEINFLLRLTQWLSHISQNARYMYI